MRAVAFGSGEEVETAIQPGSDLEERDVWDRTAWLIAVHTGDIAKADLLMHRGADIHARGRLGKPSTFYAVESGGHAMLAWLLDEGIGLDLKYGYGDSVLVAAVEHQNSECVAFLINVGMDVNEKGYVETPIWHANTKSIDMMLLDAGADPNELISEGRRSILGYEPEATEHALNVSEADFQKYRAPRFGTENPEKMNNPFWEAMIRSGVNAYRAQMRLNGGNTCWTDDDPTWSAERFGQTMTFLPDGRIVQVAGEHEDAYDPDFCIYNDVFVHELDGSITIYGYPNSLFPPTDFHSATRVGEYIYLIGSLGYPGFRADGYTPVYRLSTEDFHIESLGTTGEMPGWISRHRARLVSPHEILITGGKVMSGAADTEQYVDNHTDFVLDLQTLNWQHRSLVGA